MAIHELKEQIARLPEQPGVYLYFNADGDTIYVGKARALRDRVRNYLGRVRLESQDRRPARRGRPSRGDRHRFGGRGTGPREQPDQTADAQVQHSAARRQELPLPPTDHQRSVSACARRARRATRRQLLRRAVHARPLRAPDHVADPPAVRDALLQRSDHGQAGPAVPRVRHQALHRAVRRRDLHGARLRARRRRRAVVPRRQERRAGQDAARPHGRRRRARAFRRGGAAARRAAHRADAARPPAEDGDRGAGASRRVRPQAGPGGRRPAGLSGAQRPRRRARGAWDRRCDPRRERRRGARGGDPAVLRAAQRAAGNLRAVGTRRP